MLVCPSSHLSANVVQPDMGAPRKSLEPAESQEKLSGRITQMYASGFPSHGFPYYRHSKQVAPSQYPYVNYLAAGIE